MLWTKGQRSNARLKWRGATIGTTEDLGNLVSLDFTPGTRSPRFAEYVSDPVSQSKPITASYQMGRVRAVVNSVIQNDVANPNYDSHAQLITQFVVRSDDDMNTGTTNDLFELQILENQDGGAAVPVWAWLFEGIVISCPLNLRLGQPSRLTLDIQLTTVPVTIAPGTL